MTTTSTRYAVAPEPPAGPGEQPEPGAVDRYVSDLARWRMRRDHELRALDELARAHDDRDDLNGEVTAAMTLFHAIAQRHDLLLAAWGDGEGGDLNGGEGPGEDERGWVSQLVWGMLELPDGDAEALAMPLPDALRLSDAMATSMRVRVGADEDGVPLKDRRRALEQEVARVRDQVAEADGDAEDGLQARLDAVAERLAGVSTHEDEQEESLSALGEIGLELAAVDRAVVVGRAAHAHERADREQAVAEREHLLARGEAVRSLAEKALNTINPAPRLGIPDVAALGEVPQDPAELSTYVTNLERVGRALDQAHSTYAAALAEYADLADRAERLADTLAGCGAPTSVDLAGMLTAAKESLHTQPADIRRAAALVAAQEAYLGQLRTDG